MKKLALTIGIVLLSAFSIVRADTGVDLFLEGSYTDANGNCIEQLTIWRDFGGGVWKAQLWERACGSSAWIVVYPWGPIENCPPRMGPPPPKFSGWLDSNGNGHVTVGTGQGGVYATSGPSTLIFTPDFSNERFLPASMFSGSGLN